MSVEFKIPELGENVEKGDVVRVLVAAGDVIKVDQSVLELETDKATIDVPSTVSGKVVEVKIKAGDKVKVGQLVLVVDEAAGAKGASAPKAVPAAAEATPAPKSPETPPVDAARGDASPSKGGTPEPRKVVDFTARPQAPKVEPARPAAVAPAAAAEVAPSVPASPAVRRYARELGVNVGDVAGTGPGGRIGQDDVKEFVRATLSSPSTSSGQTLSTGSGRGRRAIAALPDFSKWGSVETKPMSNIRRKTAEHLSDAWAAIPHVTQHDKADMTAVEAFRTSYGPRVEKAGGKLTVTAVLVKIVALAIDRFPQFASSVDVANESIIYKSYRHIGVAVDTPNGLLVPVVRDANRKTLTDIAVEIGVLSQKARDKKLSLEDMSGGVMSISNLGGIGGTAFTPIVNLPEVAILGVSRGAIEPVWRDPSTSLGAGGAFVPREMLPLSLSYDHRIIDGADAVRFLRFVVDALEQPLTMVL